MEPPDSSQQEPPQSAAAQQPPPIPLPRPSVSVSAQSLALVDRYVRTENGLRARGLLRQDSGGADAAFDADDLTATFLQVAMFDEYSPVSGTLIARATARPLRRWKDPVRIRIVFGPSVPDDVRAQDRRALADLVDRLARASGHDIALTDGRGNFQVYILNEDERRALTERLVETVPGMTPAVARTLRDLPPTEFCAVVGIYDDSSPAVLRRALAFIRAEHPPLLRLSCYHEELAQGLGLGNDSPAARPSIFNDDEEFALLTGMDELLLRILYDPRLQPGMTSAQALPIVETISTELLTPRAATVSLALDDLGES
jgi:hypothetical protein